jgi:hypothetical protein
MTLPGLVQHMTARLPTRRWLASFALAAVLSCVGAVPSLAQDYQGTTDSWGPLTASVSGGVLSAFQTKTGRVQSCAGKPDSGSAYDPQDITYAGEPVAVIGGKFHLEGTTHDDWGDPFHWTIDGLISFDGRELTGTATTAGDTVFEKACTGSWQFDAILAPRSSDLPVQRKFQPAANNRSFNPSVTFDYRHGVITHLTAGTEAQCAGGTVFDAQLNTTAYGLDPVRVDRAGRFRVATAVLDGYGVVQHIVLSGRVKGRTATGTVTAYRYSNLNGSALKCTQDSTWRSTTTAASVASGPAAYFDVEPLRYGRPGAWLYYLNVKLTGCAHANKARVAVAGGAAKTTGCRGHARLGPLTPKRTYRVSVTALKTRRGRVIRHAPAVAASVYLPGDDGDWIRVP